MTKQEYKNKNDEIVQWCITETDKITKKLKKENKLQGLDTNKDEYKKIHEEYIKKLKELKEKYEKELEDK